MRAFASSGRASLTPQARAVTRARGRPAAPGRERGDVSWRRWPRSTPASPPRAGSEACASRGPRRRRHWPDRARCAGFTRRSASSRPIRTIATSWRRVDRLLAGFPDRTARARAAGAPAAPRLRHRGLDDRVPVRAPDEPLARRAPRRPGRRGLGQHPGRGAGRGGAGPPRHAGRARCVQRGRRHRPAVGRDRAGRAAPDGPPGPGRGLRPSAARGGAAGLALREPRAADPSPSGPPDIRAPSRRARWCTLRSSGAPPALRDRSREGGDATASGLAARARRRLPGSSSRPRGWRWPRAPASSTPSPIPTRTTWWWATWGEACEGR